MTMKFTVEQTAAILGVTVEQIREGHRRNLPGLQQMLRKAESTGRKVNGYTAAQLRERVAECAKRAGVLATIAHEGHNHD